MKSRPKRYRRFHYKKRRLPLRIARGQRRAVWIWYWGVDKDYGKTYCAVRTKSNPHWCIKGARRGTGYCGVDYERNRWVCRPRIDGPRKRIRIGWRYKVYG